MGPRPVNRSDADMLRMELLNLIDQRHELVKLERLIDWRTFEQRWSPLFESSTGRPALPTRLMAALLYLKHVYALSDEEVVQRWSENPYWQHFSGERYFQHELPCDGSSLTRWRKRIGEEGCEWLLAQSIEAAKGAKVIKPESLKTVVVDTTVQNKAIAHPTDSHLLNRARHQLAVQAQVEGISLRQSYARVGDEAEHQAGRYAHAKQFKRMRKVLRTLKTYLGRVIRDVQRKAKDTDIAMSEALQAKLGLAKRLHAQRRDSKNKLYALHAPEVECLAKGKARTPYEFGVKVSIATTAKEGLVVGMRSLPGNPYDGHTLAEQLEQVEILTDTKPSTVLVDRGYKLKAEDKPQGVKLLMSHTGGLPTAERNLLRRRQSIEPMIGHMKADGLLARNWLKGSLGDAMNAVLCGAGHNLRMILARLRALYWALIGVGLPAATMRTAVGNVVKAALATLRAPKALGSSA
jgi:transposase, IS5 family